MSEIERELQRIVPDEERELRQAIGQIIKVVDRDSYPSENWLREMAEDLHGLFPHRFSDRIYMMIGDELCATRGHPPKRPE